MELSDLAAAEKTVCYRSSRRLKKVSDWKTVEQYVDMAKVCAGGLECVWSANKDESL